MAGKNHGKKPSTGDGRTGELVTIGPRTSPPANSGAGRVDASVDAEEAEDLALRRQAEAIAPSRAQLDALIDRLPPSSISYDDEDDELPC